MNGAPLPIATAEPDDAAEAGAGAELATAAELVAGAGEALVAATLVVDAAEAGAGAELDGVLDAVFFDEEQAAISVAPTATSAAA